MAAVERYYAVTDRVRKSAEYLALTPNEKLVFLTVVCALGSSGIGVLYREQIAAETGLDEATVEAALATLTTQGTIAREAGVIWHVRGLASYPLYKSNNEHHRKALARYLDTLPQLSIVSQYIHRNADFMGTSQVSLFQQVSTTSDQSVDHPLDQSVDQRRKEETQSTVFGKDHLSTQTSGSSHLLSNREKMVKTVSEADVTAVLERHIALHPKRRPGEKERGVVRRALRTYTVDELTEALTGNSRDPWAVGHSKHEIGYVLRDNEHIDTARAQYESQRNAIGKPSMNGNGNGNGYRRLSPGEQLLSSIGMTPTQHRLSPSHEVFNEPR